MFFECGSGYSWKKWRNHLKFIGRCFKLRSLFENEWNKLFSLNLKKIFSYWTIRYYIYVDEMIFAKWHPLTTIQTSILLFLFDIIEPSSFFVLVDLFWEYQIFYYRFFSGTKFSCIDHKQRRCNWNYAKNIQQKRFDIVSYKN